MDRVVLTTGLLALLIFLGGLLEFFPDVEPWLIYFCYVVAISAILVASIRGGVDAYPFWTTLIASYPVLAPFIIQDILGFELFSARAASFQTPEMMVAPLMVAALSALLLSTAVARTSLNPFSAVKTNGGHRNLLLWVCLGTMAMVFFAWLTEPGLPVGLATYSELRAQRYQGTNFAGGAWATFAVFSLGLYVKLETSARAKKNFGRLIFWTGVVVSLGWLVSHARRSEVAGFLIFLITVFGGLVSNRVKMVAGLAMLLPIAAVGYFRNLENFQNVVGLVEQEYFHLPGAPGNILIGYVCAYNLVGQKALSWFYGSTYMDHILRLPPSFLGLDRPPEAYDYIEEIVNLIGGEYFLIEPYLNFGIVGIVVYLLLFVLAVNWSMRGVRFYWDGERGIMRFMLSGIFLVLIFRTMWYGLYALIKGFIMAALIAFGFMMVQGFISQYKRPHRLLGLRQIDQR